MAQPLHPFRKPKRPRTRWRSTFTPSEEALLHQLFHDGKAQARPRVRAGSRLRLLRERLERVLLELGAHADVRVGARDLERGHVVGGGKLAARDGQEHAEEQRVVRPVVGGYFARGDEMGRSGVFDKHHQ